MHKDKETLGMHASDDICIPGVLRDRVHLKYPLHLLPLLSDNVRYVRLVILDKDSVACIN